MDVASSAYRRLRTRRALTLFNNDLLNENETLIFSVMVLIKS